MNQTDCRLSIDNLYDFMNDVFLASGVPAEDAKICSDVLIASDLRGIESHGIGRLKMYYDRIKIGQIQPVTRPQVVHESPTTAVIDGRHGMGMVIAHRSMQMAIEKARKYGMGSVAVRNSSHFGIDGYYALMAVEAGMIGLSFTNARPSIAPTFGVKPMLGTNPIAFGAPTDEDWPFLFDAATSIKAQGKFEVLSREGRPCPEGWSIDVQGKSLTDPDFIVGGLRKQQAALLPLGGEGETFSGYKGYSLAVMVEILTSALQCGSFMYGLAGLDANGSLTPNKIGHFFMAINVESFCPLSDFKANTGAILRELRASPKAPGQDRIYTAGEKEYENEKFVRANGVAILPRLQKDIKEIQSELGLTQYHFPF
jgi:LDH2 family malate/lactate/ureidoglycolate dehydrogenase